MRRGASGLEDRRVAGALMALGARSSSIASRPQLTLLKGRILRERSPKCHEDPQLCPRSARAGMHVLHRHDPNMPTAFDAPPSSHSANSGPGAKTGIGSPHPQRRLPFIGDAWSTAARGQLLIAHVHRGAVVADADVVQSLRQFPSRREWTVQPPALHQVDMDGAFGKSSCRPARPRNDKFAAQSHTRVRHAMDRGVGYLAGRPRHASFR